MTVQTQAVNSFGCVFDSSQVHFCLALCVWKLNYIRWFIPIFLILMFEASINQLTPNPHDLVQFGFMNLKVLLQDEVLTATANRVDMAANEFVICGVAVGLTSTLQVRSSIYCVLLS